MLSKLVTLKSYVFTFIVLTFFTISSLSAFDISKNASEGNFEVTSWKAGGGYSVITSAGFVDGYGKVYLTHKFKANSGEALSGDLQVLQEQLVKMEIWLLQVFKEFGNAKEKP